MPTVFQIRVYDRGDVVYIGDFDGPIEVGRQGHSEPAPYARTTVEGRGRLVIAGLDEISISRRQVLLTPLEGGKVRLSNLSEGIVVRLVNGETVAPGATSEVALPAVLSLGKRTVRVQPIANPADPERLQRLTEVTAWPGQSMAMTIAPSTQGLPSISESGVESILLWFQGLLSVLQSAATSTDFFLKAAQAVVDIVGLDIGRVLLLDAQGNWTESAVAMAGRRPGAPPPPPSRRILARITEERRTLWQSPTALDSSGGDSLSHVEAVVAAPILDQHGRVLGALYGDRRRDDRAGAPPITRAEAMLVELLASGVASGLARLELEKAALAARVQFEQFFTPELARDLAAEPDLLQGRDSDVTVLFCDIRGFSRVSADIGPARTVEWISDVMGVLSDRVLDHGGVLVDYIGDELMAMWGAPKQQPDHARLACLAALDMLASLERLNDRWRDALGETMDLGIGINTGTARVGNVGSHRKFKYGPLGTTVNLGSRVQGANKYLKTRLLITGATRAHLGTDFHCRRIGSVGVVNLDDPVELHELAAANRRDWEGLRDGYELALTHFESQNFVATAQVLGKLFWAHPHDGPSLILLSRAINHLVEAPAEFSKVWKLSGK